MLTMIHCSAHRSGDSTAPGTSSSRFSRQQKVLTNMEQLSQLTGYSDDVSSVRGQLHPKRRPSRRSSSRWTQLVMTLRGTPMSVQTCWPGVESEDRHQTYEQEAAGAVHTALYILHATGAAVARLRRAEQGTRCTAAKHLHRNSGWLPATRESRRHL